VLPDFKYTNFSNCDLSNSEFVRCSTRELDFSGTSLYNSKFCMTNFINANFDGADLRNITMTRCSFDGSSFDGAICNSNTMYEYLHKLDYFFTFILDSNGRICLLASREDPNKAKLDKPLKNRFNN
jgi:uncharacterized protein YjbI with pentapeptide repeats